MSQMYTFHKTVIGHLHVMNGFPCEDSSASFSAENSRYHIAIVADGHGSKACFRSNFGSKAATDVALECLKQFAETTLESEEVENRFYNDLFSNPRYRQMTIRRLTDIIIAEWHDCVIEHYAQNPLTNEEFGEYAADCEGVKNVTHIYGTTLIAALWLPKCLLLIQQGDGRCDVFYSDGSVNQPIPWDKRCEDTATTSLCDTDVAESIRSYVIDLERKPAIACVLGCDGVEDAYRDTYEALGGSHILMGGVHTFYKDLLCQLSSMGKEKFENYMAKMLPEFSERGKFSRSGSGDDVSVAGIVDLEAIPTFVPQYKYDVELYGLEEDLFWKEDELRGKTRKHSILKKRVDDIQIELQSSRESLRSLEANLQQLKAQREAFSQKVDQAKMDLEAYRQESQLATRNFDSQYSRITFAIQHFFDEISIGYSQKETEYSKMLEDLLEYDTTIKRQEEAVVAEEESIRNLEVKLAENQSAFNDYDAKYQAIYGERVNIENEISALQRKI